ncbi:hypothetical protein STEG23_008068, partial [Scotinomys teguina]
MVLLVSVAAYTAVGCVKMKLNISFPATGCQKLIEVDDERKLRMFYEKHMATEVAADALGEEWKGYVVRISGGNDKQGFPMKQGVLTHGRVRLLLIRGILGIDQGELERGNARFPKDVFISRKQETPPVVLTPYWFLFSEVVCSGFRSALLKMEVEDLSKAEDRPEDPGFQKEVQSPAMKLDFPLEGQCPGPTVLWDMLEKKFLEYQQLIHKNPEERRKSLLSLLPLFLKAWEHSVGIICFRSLQRLAEDVSDQLAQEIQQALAGKPAEQARAAAGRLLRWRSDTDHDGYLLLKSVYVLTGTDSETLGRVIGSGLPALLLQCLYLFFAFPVEKDEFLESDVQGQRMFVQNLSKLADTLPASEVSEAVSLILTFVKDSYPVSSVLLLEFENGEGYPLLLKVLLRYDGLTQGEVGPDLEELMELVMWLTTCGRSELKVFDSVTYPQLEGFKFHPEASGVTVKNLQAFQVLQNVFHRASDSVLCTKVLLAIKTMWAWNPRNFFLLEWTLQPISQFVEIMPLKPTSVQEHFFQLLETLVFKLLYVPHEILAKVQRLIKEHPELSCTLVALRSILRITASDRLFTDIFRDSGLLGLLLAQLRKQAKIMRKSGNKESSPGVQDPERELTCVMLNTVVTLLQGSVRNAVVLKDHGMVPFIKIFLDDECYRGASLSILEQLSVINAEEYMSIIVGALCSSTQGELQLKLDLLK